ncbi:MAG: HAMP domain-containing sensor histidine kinase [Pseudomonadota bacterium]
MRWPKPRLRTLLILSNVVILLSPLAGIQVLRLYESALVRQTESALIAQGAFVAAAYRSLLLEAAPQTWPLSGRELIGAPESLTGSDWRVYSPELDLASSPVLAPFPDARRSRPALPLADAVGDRLVPMLKDAQAVTLAGIRVTDAYGVIVATTGTDTGELISISEEVRSALRGEHASRLRRRADQSDGLSIDSLSRTSDVRVFVANPIILHQRLVGTVLLSRTPPNIVQALYAKRWLLVQAFAALLILTWMMSLFASRLVTRPIAQLAARAERIADGDASKLEPLISARTFEVAKLQEGILAMTERLEQRAAALEDFSRHVSHEFKTPITSIRGAVEVLNDHGDAMDAPQRQRFLDNISSDTERLQRLTQRLLDLTRAEVAPPAARNSYDPAPVLEQAATDLSDATLRIDLREQVPLPTVRGTPDALLAALECLADNARRHGATRLTLAAEPDTAVLQLTVSDNGEGISEGNRARVFEPFFTTRRAVGGTGLGLTIARKLLAQGDGELELAPANPEAAGATFSIRLPLVRPGALQLSRRRS